MAWILGVGSAPCILGYGVRLYVGREGREKERLKLCSEQCNRIFIN